MLAFKRSAGVAPQVNLRECVTCMSLPSVNKAAHSDFGTQKRCNQKSKTGVSVVSQKVFYDFPSTKFSWQSHLAADRHDIRLTNGLPIVVIVKLAPVRLIAFTTSYCLSVN